MTKRAIVLLLISALLVACHPADQQTEPVVIDPVALESFADEFFSTQMEELHIPGVSFVFVQNGEIVLAKGYGYADLAMGNAIDPAGVWGRATPAADLSPWPG